MYMHTWFVKNDCAYVGRKVQTTRKQKIDHKMLNLVCKNTWKVFKNFWGTRYEV